ncbi:uncharacterized protein LOC123564353 [Mercenaria mercenaria]|uniref:uncharacterized protein LOC123564353 n=1 Tax=Mercenaria mercenaria TaxID=6596 RepID=UPI00234FAADF|nr:uncharacterized protein LOC123564353 [Mercenaria mercenaria]
MAQNKKKNDAGISKKVTIGCIQNSVIRGKKNEFSETGIKTCYVSGCKTEKKPKKTNVTINKPVSTSQSSNGGSSRTRKKKKNDAGTGKKVTTSDLQNSVIRVKNNESSETGAKICAVSGCKTKNKPKKTTETINKPVSISQSSNGGSKSKKITETINKPVSTSQSSNGGSSMTRHKKKNDADTEKKVTTSYLQNCVIRVKKNESSEIGVKTCYVSGSKTKKKPKKTTETINKPVSTSQSSNGGSKSKKTTETSNKPVSTSQSSIGGSKSKKTTPMKAKQERQATTLEKQKCKQTKKDSQTRKMEINLQPSDIRYSQSSISSQFQDGTNIGESLDEIFFGRSFASAIPQIEVWDIEGHWVSADNRRLWVFKQLEILGRLDFITVKVSKIIDKEKLTSKNAGMVVKIRNGDPTGEMYALMYGGQKQNTDDDSAKEAKNLGPESKRKPKTSHENNNNTDKPDNEITCLDYLDTVSNDSHWAECEKLLNSYNVETALSKYKKQHHHLLIPNVQIFSTFLH